MSRGRPAWASSHPAAHLSPRVRGSSRSSYTRSSRPGLLRSGRCGVPVLSSGLHLGSSVVVPSLAEKDPEEQQDRSREAHPGEILHRVVWGEGAQVSAGPVTHCVCPGHLPPVRRRGPEPNPTGTLSLFTLAGLTAVLGEGISQARVS